MGITDSIINYRRFLKRRNCSLHTVRNYMNTLKLFVKWLDVPVEEVSNRNILAFIDHLLDRRLKAKTVNSYLDSIRGFYEYLINEEDVEMPNPVKSGYALRLGKPLPRHLRDNEVDILLDAITSPRDRAMFLVMLRCGLRVDEVAGLTLDAVDLRSGHLFVYYGKGRKERVVYLSDDTHTALLDYLKTRHSNSKSLFLVEKGTYKGKPISVRGIQKRIEYYSKKTGVKVSCHILRHTMATQMVNADAELLTIQELLGHSLLRTTERYFKVSNPKVQRDYYKAMENILNGNFP